MTATERDIVPLLGLGEWFDRVTLYPPNDLQGTVVRRRWRQGVGSRWRALLREAVLATERETGLCPRAPLVFREDAVTGDDLPLVHVLFIRSFPGAGEVERTFLRYLAEIAPKREFGGLSEVEHVEMTACLELRASVGASSDELVGGGLSAADVSDDQVDVVPHLVEEGGVAGATKRSGAEHRPQKAGQATDRALERLDPFLERLSRARRHARDLLTSRRPRADW